MAKLNKGNANRPQTVIPAPEVQHEGLVRFSFKYLELSHEKFVLPCTRTKFEYLGKLFDRLKQISTMNCNEFRTAGKALRSHSINWSETSEAAGFATLPNHLQDCHPWQFSLAREEFGRVHGFWIGHVFFVVWIDHEHRLYN